MHFLSGWRQKKDNKRIERPGFTRCIIAVEAKVKQNAAPSLVQEVAVFVGPVAD
jgi:hypothetical protein